MQLYKKQTRVKQFFTTALILLALTGCSPTSSVVQIDCSVDVSQCLKIDTKNTEIFINTKTVVVEQNYQLLVNSELPIESMELEGVNMNMGIIPVFLKKQPNSNEIHSYKSELFLGMCSEPKMQWLIRIQYLNGKTETALFDAYWTLPE